MGIGLSFGSKKQSTSGTSNVDKTIDTSGSQQTNTQTQGQTNTSTIGTTNTSNLTQGTSQQTQDQQNVGQTTGRTTGTVTTLGQDVQDALAERIKSILAGGITEQSMSAINQGIQGNANFDVSSFVNGIVGSARNRGEQTLQEQNSAFAARAGGTAATNSMAALLAQRGRNDLEANLAGIAAQATAQGEGIRQSGLSSSVNALTGTAGIASGLASALKGGTTTTDMTSLTDEISQLIGKTGSTSSESSVGTQQQAQTSQTNQLLQEIANVLTQQQQKETGTETTTQKGKSGGFGLSLGL